MIVYDTLYKLTSIGNIQYWQICADSTEEGYGKIITEYGKLNTDKPQTTIDIIKEGKNIGKISETTPYEQATKEAEAKHNKQLKSGYVRSIEEGKDGKVDAVIEGGILPMLAHDYTKHGDKIKYPCFIQRKLDGIRILGIVNNGKCELFSRTRKKIDSLPHIVAEIESMRIDNIIFDGEAFSENLTFEEIVSIVRQEESSDKCKLINYYIYDIVNSDAQYNRIYYIDHNITDKFSYLKKVDSDIVMCKENIEDITEYFINLGWEGSIIRSWNGTYENKRSYNLLKYKKMMDSEFPIIGITEGRGKLIGHAATFICKTSEGKTFEAKMKGELSKLKEYFEDHSLWEGHRLTVQYQCLSAEDKIPRFPIGLRIQPTINGERL